MNVDEKYEELAAWWVLTAGQDAEATVPKAIEYGAGDLDIIGEALAKLMPNGEELSKREKQELGVAFYLLGKVARMFSAYQEGRMPSDDTWYDASIYTFMGRRIRHAGEWG